MELIKDPKRPYRIWEAQSKTHVRGRNYTYLDHAMNAALMLVKWGKPGQAFEVYDVRNGHLKAQYVRRPTSILILKG